MVTATPPLLWHLRPSIPQTACTHPSTHQRTPNPQAHRSHHPCRPPVVDAHDHGEPFANEASETSIPRKLSQVAHQEVIKSARGIQEWDTHARFKARVNHAASIELPRSSKVGACYSPAQRNRVPTHAAPRPRSPKNYRSQLLAFRFQLQKPILKCFQPLLPSRGLTLQLLNRTHAQHRQP